MNSDTQSGFNCMYNKKGFEFCHPSTALIGQKLVLKPESDETLLINKNKAAEFKKWQEQ